MPKPDQDYPIAELGIRVTPNAKKSEFSGFLDDGRIRIRLNAPPVDGKANAELIKFLSKALHVRKSSINIVSGFSSRDKIVRIQGIDSQSARGIFAGSMR